LTDIHKDARDFNIMYDDLIYLMKQALLEAQKAFSLGEVPVGALLAGPDGGIVAKAHNRSVSLKDPTAHAEILALRKAGIFYNNYRLRDTTLVITIEPCLMCMGAALNARVSRLVFGAYDPKAGAAGSLYNLAADDRLNHRIELIPGIMEKDCRQLIQDFFQFRRGRDRSGRGTEVVVTGSTRNRLVPLKAGHVGSNPTLSAKRFSLR
jgi:tRNA(adenine34) deaminase